MTAERIVAPGEHSKAHAKASGNRPYMGIAEEVQRLYWDDGWSGDAIARKFTLGPETARRIARFESYPNLLGRAIDLNAVRSFRLVGVRGPRPKVHEYVADALANRPRGEECWLDWPFARMWADRPSITLPAHPVTGKRWCGPVVRYVLWLEKGVWPRQWNHSCQVNECWHPGHVYPGTHQENKADEMRLNYFAWEQGPGRSAAGAVTPGYSPTITEGKMR